MTRTRKAFVLPFMLLLSASLMVVVTLLLQQARFELKHSMLESLHERTMRTFELNVPAIVDELERILSASPTATFIRRQGEGSDLTCTTYLVNPEINQALPLVSTTTGNAMGTAGFNPSFGNSVLRADRIRLTDNPVRATMDIAWAVEDISISAPNRTAKGWWPLPEWQMTIANPMESPSVFRVLSGTDPEYTPVPAGSPLPFSTGDYAPLMPVLRQVRLKFGIFASGNVGHREHVIRIRYYLECSVWNPYNRTMQFHNQSSPAPVFQLVVYNLPMIRISNPSKGVSTSWIDMDTTYNNQSGASGLHAWIRLKANLQPGETITVTEPDANRQPEGLARILHPSFMVSPADQIRIEFKHKDEGIALACLAIDDPDPVISAKSGAGWATYENYKVEFPHLIFTRADDPEQPFYLSSGSLSFRQHHTQLELSAELQSQYFLDPRKSIISQDKEYLDASGSLVSGRDLLDISVLNDRTSESPAQNLHAWYALVSWPDAPSAQLMQLTDLRDWENAFCLGSRGAVAINSILDDIWPFRQDDLLHRETPDGHRLQFARSVHINTNQPDIWKSLLGSSPGPEKTATMALYPSPVTDADYFVMDDFSLTGMASRLANLSLVNPVFSISDFFNRGRLSDAMASQGNDSLQRLLQLRGFNGNSFRLMPSGTAFILHLMCTAQHNGMERSITARMWMLRVPKPGNKGNLEIIHIEWTDPGHHLASLN